MRRYADALLTYTAHTLGFSTALRLWLMESNIVVKRCIVGQWRLKLHWVPYTVPKLCELWSKTAKNKAFTFIRPP